MTDKRPLEMNQAQQTVNIAQACVGGIWSWNIFIMDLESS